VHVWHSCESVESTVTNVSPRRLLVALKHWLLVSLQGQCRDRGRLISTIGAALAAESEVREHRVQIVTTYRSRFDVLSQRLDAAPARLGGMDGLHHLVAHLASFGLCTRFLAVCGRAVSADVCLGVDETHDVLVRAPFPSYLWQKLCTRATRTAAPKFKMQGRCKCRVTKLPK
jgi:hypothetical protein